MARLRSLEFSIIEYRGFFGHAYYQRIPILRTAAKQAARVLIDHPEPRLTTYAYLILQKEG